MTEVCECCGGLSGEHEDDCDVSGMTIEETYCKKHPGFWPHECCDKTKKEMYRYYECSDPNMYGM